MGDFEIDTACFSSWGSTVIFEDASEPPNDHGPSGLNDFVFNKSVITLAPGCICDGFADLNFDGGINPTDVVLIVNFVYKDINGISHVRCCPNINGDWNCDRKMNPTDVVGYVNYVYKSEGYPCDPCWP
jgi:hypothetical protein